MSDRGKCPFCTTEAFMHANFEEFYTFYVCPVCGRFELKGLLGQLDLDRNHTAAYLAYHCFTQGYKEHRYHTTRSKEECDEFKTAFEAGDIDKGHPVHIDKDIVENWYPKTFAERIDRILLYFYKCIKHVGQEIRMPVNQLLSVLFIDEYEFVPERTPLEISKWEEREHDECLSEANYMLHLLEERGYIETEKITGDGEHRILLTPLAYERVDEIQKKTAHGRQVLVAMQFRGDTKALREAIRLGITSAGYIAVFIDEVQHNELITPELLKHIRDSKFVVVDLTHHNNGAYFEEGYAMGLGKPVIQLCKNGAGMHFDISQINTIMWDTEADIPERLKNRIIATID